MATYREQLQALENVRLREGEDSRVDCMFCGGRKTLTISRHQGTFLWNCYRASCGAKGRKGSEMSSDTIRSRLAKAETELAEEQFPPMPTHLSHYRHHQKCISYLEEVNSMEAVTSGLVDVRFSPSDNRLLFMKPDNVGAAGRALDRRKPKWKVYGDTTGIFRVGKGSIGVIVEDVASACSVSRLPQCSGCALLGTHATTLHKAQLREFDALIVALDKDASRKALRLQAKLEGRTKTRVVYLEEDLKYLPVEELRGLIL